MKFSVGEVCECRSLKGRFDGWRECVILRYGSEADKYISKIHAHLGEPFYLTSTEGFEGMLLFSAESTLRKKRPPADHIPESVREIFKIEVTA